MGISHAYSAPIFLIGAESLRVGAVSGLAKPPRSDAPEGGLDAVPTSWTMEAEEDGLMRHWPCPECA